MAGHRLILHIGSMPFSNIPAMAGAGDRIVDLHSLLSEISPEISAYLFPGLDSGTPEETCTRIQATGKMPETLPYCRTAGLSLRRRLYSCLKGGTVPACRSRITDSGRRKIP